MITKYFRIDKIVQKNVKYEIIIKKYIDYLCSSSGQFENIIDTSPTHNTTKP